MIILYPEDVLKSVIPIIEDCTHLLSYNIFEFYKPGENEIIDTGSSTINSQLNSGLLEFKESIGCAACTKMSFKFDYQLDKNYQ